MENSLFSQSGEPAIQVMLYHPTNPIWFYLLAVALLMSLAAYSWRYRQNPAAFYLSLGLADKAIWLLAIAMVTISPSQDEKLRWIIIQNLDAMALVPITVLIAHHITGQPPARIRAVQRWLLPLTGLAFLFLLTNQFHGWFWRGFLWDGAAFGIIRGPANRLLLAAAYIGFAYSMFLFIRHAVRSPGLRRWQALAVPANMVISLVGHARWLQTQSDLIPGCRYPSSSAASSGSASFSGYGFSTCRSSPKPPSPAT